MKTLERLIEVLNGASTTPPKAYISDEKDYTYRDFYFYRKKVTPTWSDLRKIAVELPGISFTSWSSEEEETIVAYLSEDSVRDVVFDGNVATITFKYWYEYGNLKRDASNSGKLTISLWVFDLTPTQL